MRPNGNCDDLLFFALSFLDGAGDVEITATLAPVTPSANPQTFALILDQDPSIEPVFGIWRRVNPDLISSPCGVGLQALVGLLPQDGSGDPAEVLGCDAIDPAAVTGNIVLKFIVDDQSNEIHSLYSIDGGANFIDSLSFDAPTGPITGFPIELTYDFALVALGGPHPPDADKDTKDTKDSKDSKDTKDADKDSKNK